MHNGGTMNDELHDFVARLKKKYGQEIAEVICILNNKQLTSEEKIAKLEKDFDRQFLAHFMRVEDQFVEMQAAMQNINTRIDSVYSLLGADIKRRETDEQERLIMSHQLDRHELWLDQLAVKTNTELPPGR
jgi:F0F1-type ATP synthase beta subunit